MTPLPPSSLCHRAVLLAAALLLSTGLPAEPLADDDMTELFGEPEHKLVYQFNSADPEYMKSVLFSVGEMLRRHGDNIRLVVTAIGPGLHILGKQPERPIPKLIQQRVQSLAQYGVKFHACGNTMEALHWDASDLFEFAAVVDVGADDLMQLQEQGYSYISW